jgi:hypothetical protein
MAAIAPNTINPNEGDYQSAKPLVLVSVDGMYWHHQKPVSRPWESSKEKTAEGSMYLAFGCF